MENTIHDYDVNYPKWQREAYENLANAIVKGAADSYISYVASNGVKDDRNKTMYLKSSDGHGKSLEDWFRSQWYTTLTSLDGEYMIKKCREEAYILRTTVYCKKCHKRTNRTDLENITKSNHAKCPFCGYSMYVSKFT